MAKKHDHNLMHPLISHGIRSRRRPLGTPAVRSACSPNVSINGRIRSSGQLGKMVVQHQPLPKQRMRAPLHRVRLQPTVIPDALARRTQQRQHRNRQRADQQQAVPPVRPRDMHRRQAHSEAHVLDVPKARPRSPSACRSIESEPASALSLRWPPNTTVRPSSGRVRNTTAPTGHSCSSVTRAPTSRRARPPAPTHAAAARRSPRAFVT